jgi:chromosome segregation ATPase
MSTSQGQPSRDREWEHWPGRRAPDDGFRGRLRSLFSATDEGEAAVEELIAEHGRELEYRTRQLAATISDLERREERTRELRAAIEDMLRRGSAELDERHADLNGFAQELARREEELAATEHELADRRQELGAVELRRAAAERRESALNDREAELAKREAALQQFADELAARERAAQAETAAGAGAAVAELAAREAELTARANELAMRTSELASRQVALDRRATELEARSAAPAPALQQSEQEPERDHLVFLYAERYRLVEAAGPAPPAGASLELDGAPFVVVRVGASPLPGDTRRCAFVEPAFAPDVQ